MVLKSKWFRLGLAFAVSLAFVILGILGLSSSGSLVQAADKHGITPGNVFMGIIFFIVALANLFFFLSHDFLLFTKKDHVTLRLCLALICAFLFLIANLLVWFLCDDYIRRQSLLIKYDLSEMQYNDGGSYIRATAGNTFFSALLLMPFGFTYIITSIISGIVISRGETATLPFVQLIGLIVSYFVGYLLLMFGGKATPWIYLVFFVLIILYYLFIDLGLIQDKKKKKSAGGFESIDAGTDPSVAAAMKKLRYSYALDYRGLPYGVTLWFKLFLQIQETEIRFVMNYHITGAENVKSESAAKEVQRNFESEMNEAMRKLADKAEKEILNCTGVTKTYRVSVVPGENV